MDCNSHLHIYDVAIVTVKHRFQVHPVAITVLHNNSNSFDLTVVHSFILRLAVYYECSRIKSSYVVYTS